MRQPDSAISSADAWTVVGICTTGWMISAFLTAYSVSFDQVSVLIAQMPWG